MPGKILTCPVCGKTGTETGAWDKPGVAAGTIMTGLDPENCKGCVDTLNRNGYAVVVTQGDGTVRTAVEGEFASE